MPIQISYKYQIQGAEDVKKRLKEINEEYNRGEMSIEKYRKSLSDVNRDAKSLNQTQNISKNIMLATHPALNRLTRGISIFGSVSRTAMSIMNSLNLANLTASSIDSQGAQITADLAQKRRELALELSKTIPDMIKVAGLQEDINLLEAQSKEHLDAINNQKFDGFITTLSGLGTAISTTFSLLMSNGTIRNQLIRAASFLGGVFGGFFTFISKTTISALDWLFPALTGKNAMIKTAAGGSTLGATFGTAFAAAAAIAIPAALVAAILGSIDVALESLTGFSFVREIEKSLGIKDPKSVQGHMGIHPASGGLLGMDDYEQYINESGFGKKQKAVKEEVVAFQPLIDLFTKEIGRAHV